MKSRNIITVVLLLFVAASVVMLVAKGLRQGPGAAKPENASPHLADGLVVYYFHSNARCPTCRSIEAYASEAVHGGFARQLDTGRMQWRVVNYEEPAYRHHVAEFNLIAPTVILVKMQGGAQSQWNNLARVWELVDEKDAFISYVQDEIRALLTSSGKQELTESQGPTSKE